MKTILIVHDISGNEVGVVIENIVKIQHESAYGTMIWVAGRPDCPAVYARESIAEIESTMEKA